MRIVHAFWREWSAGMVDMLKVWAVVTVLMVTVALVVVLSLEDK